MSDSDEEKFDQLVNELSKICDGYALVSVLPSAMCIAEKAIRILKENTDNFTTNMEPSEEIGYQLTAQRLEYLAQLLRGEDIPDPHEDVLEMIQSIQEQINETTH